MPNIHANGISIAYEEAGEGFPLILAHEFAGSMESWQAQVHFFARRYRVITYNARGYPPTEVPETPEAYSQDIAVEDMKGLLDALGIKEAYIGGLSMGGSLALHFGLRHPEMARALIVAAAGTGSTNPEESRAMWYQMADAMERDGMPSALADYAEGPARVQLRRKDPERAELLYRARSHSQEQNILSEMQTIAELLRTQTAGGAEASPQYGPAADRQKELLVRMKIVLKLLQSQDERERVAAEIARIQELLKETNKIIARQKDVRADTQRSRDLDKNKEAQDRVAEEARKLAEKMQQQDQERQQNSPGSPPPSDPQKDDAQKDNAPKDTPQSDGKPGDNQKDSGDPSKPEKGDSKKNDDGSKPMSDGSEGKSSPDEKKGDESGKPSDGSDSQSGSPMEGQPSGEPQSGEGQPSQGSPGGEPPSGEQPPQSPAQKDASQKPADDSRKTPGREQLEQAREEMKQAIEKLLQKDKEKAVAKQDEAVAKLEELKAKLEQILRQLREDERESFLTMLEARFQNMLRRQQHVNTETIRVDKIPQADRSQQNYASQTDNIRKEQDDNALEAEKALHLLKEEGSSVAFPEAVQQMHKNMLLVSSRLARQDTAGTTQVIEKMIADTLEEMIAALRQELQKQQEQKQQGQPAGQGEQEFGLVNQLAELKLIRSLQLQINLLTTQIGTEVVNGVPGDPDQIQLLQDLRARQERIQEATYDLSVGRNK